MSLNRQTGLLHQVRRGGLAGQLVLGGIGSVAIKAVNTLLGFVLAIVLARTLGAEGYGTYAYILALISILVVPAQFGLPTIVVRETARAHVNEQWDLMRGLWRWSSATAGVFAIGMVIVALGTVWLASDRFSELQVATFLWGLILVPLIVLGNLRGVALRGLRRVVLGQLPESVLRPGILILLVLASNLLGANEKLTAANAMKLNAIATGVAFIIGTWLLYRCRPTSLKTQSTPVYKPRAWLAAAWPLALVAGMRQIINYTDIIMLGLFDTAKGVGVYRVSVQGAIFVAFGVQVIGMFIQPYFTRLYAQGDFERLQRLVTIGARAAFCTALPITVVFVTWGDGVLRLFFGTSYMVAYGPLSILSIGQLIHVLFGPVGILLSMTGHEHYISRIVVICAVVNVLLNLFLIPLFGMNGAAMATALSLIIGGALQWQVARRCIGIDTMAVRVINTN